jgi:hypothetical protein
MKTNGYARRSLALVDPDPGTQYPSGSWSSDANGAHLGLVETEPDLSGRVRLQKATDGVCLVRRPQNKYHRALGDTRLTAAQELTSCWLPRR